ncbi:hypothetical protein QE444_000612 [Pseudomonas sp. SORGH_AS199]|uniref:hypothetical protein n=1 Tax=Pseudomonas sp. SORGH_AS_0199 TaxID=3041761 RepID=UPI0028613703|nr:hypothetical protein [Pseudomonas sp. SORGH_AS_0199]MDR6228255.1 hypothetical protein [Pseudomonas sp. SORGH_AS_0199]
MDAEIKGFWSFVCSLFGVGLGTFLIGFLGKTQIENRLRASIEHEYSKDLECIKDEIIRDQVKAIEELKREIQIRDRAAKIADLLSEWFSCPESRKKLNLLTFEAFLWLPDEILEDLSAVLSHSPDAPDVRQVLSKVRKHLLEPTNLGPGKLIIFKDDASKCSCKNDQKLKIF